MGLSTRSFALLAFLTLSLAAKTSSTPTTTAAASATSQAYSSMTSEGCYSSSGDMTDQGSFQWQSSLHCQEVCVALNKPVLGLTGGGNCWCGDLLPAASAKVADSQCSTPCNGYPSENCTYSHLASFVNKNLLTGKTRWRKQYMDNLAGWTVSICWLC